MSHSTYIPTLLLYLLQIMDYLKTGVFMLELKEIIMILDENDELVTHSLPKTPEIKRSTLNHNFLDAKKIVLIKSIHLAN